MAIFAGMPLYGMIMGIVVELGKVVGITWIYRNWNKKTLLKWIGFPMVAVAMGLTSMGIYGLLSKAHLEQTAPVTNNTAQIERLDQRIIRERTEIADAEAVILQLDKTVQVLIDFNRISHPTTGARAVRAGQQDQRDLLKNIIDESFDSIDEYEDTKLTLNQELNELELEVGPVKYIAAVIFDEPQENFDKAVRIVIIAFIFVFDPMAILLLMMGNYTLMGRIGVAPEPKTPTNIKPSPKARYAGFPAKKEPPHDEPDPTVTSVDLLGDRQIEIVEPEPEILMEVEPEQESVATTVEQEVDNTTQLKHHRDILDQQTNQATVKPHPPMPTSVLDGK